MLTFELSRAYPSIKMVKFLLNNKADPNKIIESKSLTSDSDSEDSGSDQKIIDTATHDPLLVTLYSAKRNSTYKKKINVILDLLFQAWCSYS